MPGAVFIEGDTVNLRTVEEEDLEFIRDTYNHPEVWESVSHNKPKNLEQEQEFFEEVICGDEEVNFAIGVEGEMIGLIGLKPKNDSTGEIGIWLHPDFHGNGYGTEASELLIEHAFDELRYHKIYTRAFEGNQASQKVWEKLGFTQEGELREQRYRDGEYESTIVYGLLEDEWSE